MKSREIHTLVLIVLLCLVFLTTCIGNGQIIVTKQIQSTGLVNAHASGLYTVSKDGIYTVLSDSGGEIARNTNAITIINQGITLANTNSRSVLIMAGQYSLGGSIDMKSNVIVYVQLNVTFTVTAFSYTSRRGVVDFRGVTNAHFVTETDPVNESQYPIVNCQGTSDYECGVAFQSGATFCSIGKIRFNGAGGYGVCIAANRNTCNGTYIYGFTKAGGSNHHGVAIRFGNNNRLINVHVDGLKGANTNHCLYLGAEGPLNGNEIRGGIYENSAVSHASYWCAEGGLIENTKCVGTIFRGCRGNSYSTGLKLNTASHSRIGIEDDGTLNPVIIYDCQIGFQLSDGNPGAGYIGGVGNVVYAIIRNCRKGSEWHTEMAHNVENNEVHLDIDGNDPNYPKTGEAGFTGFDFGGYHSAPNTYLQNNTIYAKVRNCQIGIGFAGWDAPTTATQEPRYNTFYLDVDAISGHAIYWVAGCGGYGRWNIFNGYWHSNLAGNCGSIPNADYVYTDDTSWISNIGTNTFNPG